MTQSPQASQRTAYDGETMRYFLPLIALALATLGAAGCSSPFTASGVVVDQDGNPIDGAKLGFTRAAARGGDLDSYAGESSMVLQDGKFKVSCGFCTAFHLFFYKEGYYDQSLDLAVFEKKNGLRIVLRRVEFPVELRRYSGAIKVGADIDDGVLGFSGKTPHIKSLAGLERLDVTPARPYVTLSIEETDASTPDRESGPPVDRRAYYLDFAPARGGVIFHEPSTKNLREGLKEMFVAPEGDYPTRVQLEPRSEHRFFFCHVAGQYCKGIVHAPTTSQRDGREVTSAAIELHLSPYYGNRSLDDPTPY